MTGLGRSYWFAALLCVYTAAASLESAGLSWPLGLTSVSVPLFLAWVWKRSRRAEERNSSELDARAFGAFRIAVAAASAYWLARLGEPQHPALELLATSSAGTCAMAAAYALARIPEAPGLLGAPKSAHSMDATAFTGLLWSVALVVSANRFVAPGLRPLDPLTLDYANTAASIGSTLVLIAVALRARLSRRLELGVGDRAAGALALSITSLAVAVPVAAMNIAPPDRVLPAALLVASLATIGCVVVADARHVAAAMRGTISVMVLGVPVVLLTGALAQVSTRNPAPIVLIGCVLSIFVGLIARAAARPLGPEQSRWLLAVDAASSAALTPEPREAIVRTLEALGATSTSPKARPELWMIDPPQVATVNVAGNLEEREAEAPKDLYELGLTEPERVVRTEVLEALQVRKASVRPLLAWFEARGAFSATVIVDEEGPIGCLVLPRGGRTEVMSLEEARAVRMLADRVSALLSVTSAMARARKRQLEAMQAADRWQALYQSAQTVLDGAATRHIAFAKNLARPLVVAAYSPAIRLLLSDLERASKTEDVISLIVPIGVDAEGYAALSHLSSPRKGGPLLCVEGALDDPREATRWSDEATSPVALAEGGTLFIRDVDRMSPEAQEHLVSALTKRWEARNRNGSQAARLLLGLRRPPSVLLASGALQLPAAWVQRAVLQLPTLAERPEDLRSLILDTTGRLGSFGDGAPLGVERRALQALLDYSWPGNEAELRDVLGRLTDVATGPVATHEDLQAIGFAGAVFSPIHAPEERMSGHEPTGTSQGLGSEEPPARRPRPRAPRTRRRH